MARHHPQHVARAGGSLFASLLSARAYLEQELSMKNDDNASALALSLSQQHPDM